MACLLPMMKRARWICRLLALSGVLIVSFRCLAAQAETDQVRPNVSALILRLKDTNPKVRLNAAQALARLADISRLTDAAEQKKLRVADDALIAALKDSDEQVRVEAGAALGLIRDDVHAVEPLLAALKEDSSPKVRSTAADALGLAGDRSAVEPLIAALEDSDAHVRGSAAYALGDIKDARAVEPLIAALHDPDDGVRTEAAASLGSIKDLRAAQPLLAMLQDPAAVASAARSLGLIGYDGALDPLIHLLKYHNSDIGWSAAEGLGELKDPRAVPALIAALGQGDDPFADEIIARALREIGQPAVEPLVAALKDADVKRRSAAASVLGQMPVSSADAARASDALIALLNDSDVHNYAKWALANNKSQLHSVEALISALTDPDTRIRYDAAEVLAETQDPHAAQALTEAMDDTDSGVREKAREALNAVSLAREAGPPPSSDVDYKVISTLELTAPFNTKTKWGFTVFQKPDTCDPDASDGCNGAYEFCFVHLDKSKCDEVVGAIFDDVSIIAPDRGPSLLVTTTHPDVATSGSGVEAIDFWAYRDKSDGFESVFSNRSSHNNNEETRIMKKGPLAGMIVVATQGERAPYGYGITVYRLSKALRYAPILKYVGKTRYLDGDAMPVIDSEMPEIERRLGFWKPGDPLPVPERAQCTSYVLKDGIEWCP